MQAVAAEPPEIARTSGFHETQLENGGTSPAGIVLVVQGIDGLGRPYSTDFTVVDSGGDKRVALNPIYWRGAGVGPIPYDGVGVAAPTETSISVPVIPADEPVLPFMMPTDSTLGMQAVTTGQILIEGRCLYLGYGPDVKQLPIFPFDSAVWDLNALVYRGERYVIGDSITLGGGERSWRDDFPLFQQPDAACEKEKVWFVSP